MENFNIWGWYTAYSVLTYFCHSGTFRIQICPIWQFDLSWLEYIFWTLISNVETSKLIFCLFYWIRMDLGSLNLKGPQCLCKTFELRQGQPKIVISGPLYSYALEFFDARWTIRLWYLYQVHCVEMNSVLCNGMDP